MACFATPCGLRYAAHCFKSAHAQQRGSALIPAGGKHGVTSLLHHWSPFSLPCWSPSPVSRVVQRLRQCCSPPRCWWGRAMPHLDHQQPLRQFHPIDRWRMRQLHIQIRRRCGTDLRGAVPHRLRRRAGWVSVYRRMPSGRCAVHHGALVVRTRPAALKNAAKHGWLKRLSAFGSNRSRVECPK